MDTASTDNDYHLRHDGLSWRIEVAPERLVREQGDLARAFDPGALAHGIAWRPVALLPHWLVVVGALAEPTAMRYRALRALVLCPLAYFEGDLLAPLRATRPPRGRVLTSRHGPLVVVEEAYISAGRHTRSLPGVQKRSANNDGQGPH